MSRLLCLIFPALLLYSCTSMDEKMKECRKEVLSTDRAFSMMSAEKGTNTAFLYYAAEDAIKLQDGSFPVIGLNALRESFMSLSDSDFRLTWEPVKAEISRSCDLAYTFGNYELTDFVRQQTRYGNYITIWRKQDDGSWRWVLDSGNSTPRPH